MSGEQAAATPAADSRTVEQRIGAWFESPKQEQPKAQPQAPEPQETQQPTSEQPTDQAQEQPEATSETAPAFVEVEYEGSTYQVPPELKEAIIRQSDYTRKTQDVAKTRELLEHQQSAMRLAAINQEFERSLATEKQQLSMLDYVIAERAKANWSQMTDSELLRAKLEVDQLKEQKASVEAEVAKKQQEFMGKWKDQLKAHVAEADKLLRSRIPQWNENTAKEVRDWALQSGFTSEEINSIHDPRHAEVLFKAAQYDKLKKTATPAVAQAKAAKVGASNPMPQDVREKLNFRKQVAKTEGDVRARQEVVKQRIGTLFGKK